MIYNAGALYWRGAGINSQLLLCFIVVTKKVSLKIIILFHHRYLKQRDECKCSNVLLIRPVIIFLLKKGCLKETHAKNALFA